MDHRRAHDLVLANLGLAGQLAGNWVGKIPGFDRDDLYQECLLALLTAAEYWNESRLTFASWGWLCMERHLGRIRNKGDLVKTPLYLAALVETARQAISRGQPETAAIAALPTTPERRRLVAFALQAHRPIGPLQEDG